MTSEKVTFWVTVERTDDREVFKMRATAELVNQLRDELRAQKASQFAVGSWNSQVIGEMLFTVGVLIGGRRGVVAVINAMTGFLRRHDGKEITAHIGEGEGKPVTLKGYPKEDAMELLRLATEAAGTDPSSLPTSDQVESSSEEPS
jgi:hypothetical protein